MRYLRFLFVFMYALVALPVMAHPTPASQLTQLLGSFTSYQADFKQWTVDEHQQILAETSGTFEIQRPNKFCWQTLLPNKTLIVTNGHTLWHYDASLMQATQQVLQPGSAAENPAMLLSSGVDHLSKQFQVSIAQLHDKPWFELQPKTAQNYQKIFLYFQDKRLTQIIVVNNLGQRSLFQFSNVRVNQSIPPNQFNFKPPKGVDVDVQQ